MAEDPDYDREAWPELKEALDRNHPEYRKHFPDQIKGQLMVAQGSSQLSKCSTSQDLGFSTTLGDKPEIEVALVWKIRARGWPTQNCVQETV